MAKIAKKVSDSKKNAEPVVEATPEPQPRSIPAPAELVAAAKAQVAQAGAAKPSGRLQPFSGVPEELLAQFAPGAPNERHRPKLAAPLPACGLAIQRAVAYAKEHPTEIPTLFWVSLGENPESPHAYIVVGPAGSWFAVHGGSGARFPGLLKVGSAHAGRYGAALSSSLASSVAKTNLGF